MKCSAGCLVLASLWCLLPAGGTWGAEVVISRTSPFDGDLTESWENIGGGCFDISSQSIMGGRAHFTTPNASIFVDPDQTNTCRFGLGFSSGFAQTHDGLYGAGVDGTPTTVTIVFDTPVVSFGGYFGAATDAEDPATVGVRFLGAQSQLIGEESFSYSRSATGDGLLEWHGWSSAVPFTAVELTGSYMAMDSLRATTVPEPSFLLIAGAAVIPLATYWSRHSRVTGPRVRRTADRL